MGWWQMGGWKMIFFTCTNDESLEVAKNVGTFGCYVIALGNLYNDRRENAVPYFSWLSSL